MAASLLSTSANPEVIQSRLGTLVQYSKCKTWRLLNQHFEKLIKCQVSFQQLLHHSLIALAILQSEVSSLCTGNKYSPLPLSQSAMTKNTWGPPLPHALSQDTPRYKRSCFTALHCSFQSTFKRWYRPLLICSLFYCYGAHLALL